MSNALSGGRQELDGLLTAVMFLTRVPVFRLLTGQPDLQRSLAWYPLVGLLIGLVVLAPLLLLGSASHSLLIAVVSVTLWVLITGGLHLDGFADMVDGWVGGGDDKARTLTIMKDPAAGPMAVIALVMLLLLKVAALQLMFQWSHNLHMCLVIVAIPVIARMILLPVFLLVPAASNEGFAAGLKESLNPSRCYMSLAVTITALLLAVPFKLLLAWVAAVLLVVFLWRRAVLKRLQGFNGDCAGALVEVTEVVLLLVMVIGGNALL